MSFGERMTMCVRFFLVHLYFPFPFCVAKRITQREYKRRKWGKKKMNIQACDDCRRYLSADSYRVTILI